MIRLLEARRGLYCKSSGSDSATFICNGAAGTGAADFRKKAKHSSFFRFKARLGSASLRTADVLLGKFKRDVSFALRRGTIAQVTTHHHHLALDGFTYAGCTYAGYAWPTRARPPRMRSSSLPLPSIDERRATSDGQAG